MFIGPGASKYGLVEGHYSRRGHAVVASVIHRAITGIDAVKLRLGDAAPTLVAAGPWLSPRAAGSDRLRASTTSVVIPDDVGRGTKSGTGGTSAVSSRHGGPLFLQRDRGKGVVRKDPRHDLFMKRFAALSILVVLSAAAAVLAQQAPAFRAGVQTVPIYASAIDASGWLVPSLEREHFEVLDNGAVQQLTMFESDVQPIKVVVMLDTSGSMTLHLKLLKLAAEQFVLRLLPDDRARIGSFSDKIILSPTFTGDRDELIRVIHNDIQHGNPTHLWDAIDASMTARSREQGRRVVLIFTDGEDMYSKRFA